MSYVNVKTDTKWNAYDPETNEWKALPSGLDKAVMQKNYADAVERGCAIVKVYYVKGTDFKVGHECLMTEGIRSLPDDFLLKDMEKLIVVGNNNNNNFVKPKFTPKDVAEKAAASSFEAPF
mgnify:FL=1